MPQAQNYDQLEILYEYSVDYSEREMFLFEEIDEGTGRIYLMDLLRLLKNLEPITIYIKSPGGDDYYMFALWDLMVNSPNKIITMAFGEACSAAPFILAAGTIGHRYISENTTAMSHQTTEEMEGKTTDLVNFSKHMDDLEDRWATALASRTKKTKKAWLEYTKLLDMYISAKEAIKLGLADHFYTNQPKEEL